MDSKTNRTLRLRLRNDSSPDDFKIVLAILRLTQEDVAKALEPKVTRPAVAFAINNNPLVKKLRKRIILHLNKLQGYGKNAAPVRQLPGQAQRDEKLNN